MTIKELKKELEKYEDNDTLIITVGDDDKDLFSSSEVEVITNSADEYCEIFMHAGAKQQL